MNKLFMGAAALAFVALGSTGASASNILTNGGFGTSDFSGWTLSGAATDDRTTRVVDYTIGSKFLTGSSSSFVPQDPYGSSTKGVFLISHQAQTISLSQTFNVATAGNYEVSFDVYAPSNDRATAVNTYLNSTIGSPGNVLTLNSLDSTSLSGGGTVQGVTPESGWYRFAFNEQLQAGANSINFSFLVPKNPPKRSPNAASTFVLTNVGVANLANVTGAVPEPATWGMMILGFFGLGAVVRRRSTAAASIA